MTTTLLLALLLLASFALFLLCAAPAPACNRRPKVVRTTATLLIGWLFGLALLGFLGRLLGSIDAIGELRWPAAGPLACGVYYDGVSSLVLLLVSFVGLIVCRYSLRYLDGDSQQGNYFRWVAATIGSVSLLVLSGNLLMLVAAWVSTSLSLHHLLLHFPTRAGAQRAAWTKFVISRAGDLFLAAALILVFREFGTFDLSFLFAAVSADTGVSPDRANALAWIGWLIVCGGITKSAQFPLHSWLPDTLETPTPVSALMHAGVVNAGGYLIIRLSRLVVHAPVSLDLLAIIGTTTALYAGITMLTQSSVKKKLAYSTVAQMGFMMLQCGLGAFSAAMLHLVAHSLYKAYAFLNSGNVLKEERATRLEEGSLAKIGPSLAKLPLMGAAVAVGCATIAWLIGFDLSAKSGGYALAAVFCLALTTGLWESLAFHRKAVQGAAAIAAGVVTLLYLGSYQAIDAFVGVHVAPAPADSTAVFAGWFVVTAFLGLAALQVALRSRASGPWHEALYVHAWNGFYADAALTHFFALFTSKKK
ncbi:proton-conducting transporter transmembrane domain-containing protein [Botrimarina hoheduenensis]|uniref:Probable inorganic carbon transporter subunit DabB n=1 Tax=Botrimarina hoheduenensis TaxID=2528000 RepID=A0A5C5WCA1_9BACT|nr:proton-conducting transporter membrane subunit [Botrimarina hoheduenensis]TWT48300.1 NADH-quinone oxidoreductase subunit L [Botrimarina hoheduenensis]